MSYSKLGSFGGARCSSGSESGRSEFEVDALLTNEIAQLSLADSVLLQDDVPSDGSTNRECLDRRNALVFLDAMRSMFRNDPDVYNKIDAPEMLERLSTLSMAASSVGQTQPQSDLMLGDVALVPAGGQPTLMPNNTSLTVTDALEYLDRIKAEFLEHPEVYNTFLDIMKDFKGQKKNTPDTVERVYVLLAGHQDLINGFHLFLPDEYRAGGASHRASAEVVDPKKDPSLWPFMSYSTEHGVLDSTDISDLDSIPDSPELLHPSGDEIDLVCDGTDVSEADRLPASSQEEDPTITSTPRFSEPFSKASDLCLDGRISGRSKYIVASGGYADVWTGFLENKTVAIKTMRAFSSVGAPIQRAKLLKRLWREYLVWSHLSHPNVLQCLGFAFDFTPETEFEVPSLISPWMANGTVLPYIQAFPSANRARLIMAIANGLSYLHNRDPAIVHGDVRAGNILVSDSGIPCLTDFGLSRILSKTRGMSTSSDVGGSLRWMSPELLHGNKISTNSDVWAYGMTILEIQSGKRPYHELPLEPMVIRQIIKGRVPARRLRGSTLSGLSDSIWGVCLQCWQFEPVGRPSMHQVILQLTAELN